LDWTRGVGKFSRRGQAGDSASMTLRKRHQADRII
jgi:hypothetical protein